MTAGGAGEGNEAAATAQIKAMMPMMFKALSAFPVGSKKYKAVVSSIQALNPVFEGAENATLVPAAVQQMAAAAKGGPLASAPAPGIQAAPPAAPDKMAA